MSYVSEEIVKDLVPGQADLCSRSGGLRCQCQSCSYMGYCPDVCSQGEHKANDIKGHQGHLQVHTTSHTMVTWIRNDPHGHRQVNTWSPVGGSVREV